MTTECPICGKPVDTLRAPAVSVRDGKVVSYCSRECAAAAETKPTIVPAAVPAAASAAKPRARTEPPNPPPRPRTPAGGVPTPPGGVPKATPPGGVPTKTTPASGVPRSASAYDSGPVIEIVHEPVSGVVTSAADARAGKTSTNARAETSGAIQIADTGHLDDYINADEPLHKSRLGLVLLLVLVLGGGVFAAYQFGYLDSLLKKDSHAVAPAKPVETPVVDANTADATPKVTAAASVEKAREVLRHALRSDSPRVQRVAAEALARTGDPEALAQLAGSLAKETSDVAKIEILYALARGGDKRGVDGLVAGLGAPRRDVKLEAARRLALLGDKRAIDTLAQYLEVSQLRLGAAEQLAYLAEPRAIKVLETVQADPKSIPDEKARAAIALGHAGKAAVAPALHDLLKVKEFSAFAAASLARLHDASAHPLLVKQLEVSSLRVAAARSLRTLDPALDPVPLLPPLIASMSSAKDTEQVQAAEAVLLLAGPPAWSEHD
jgi:HEAT repeat protein/YHS domain-containing protein